MKSRTSERNRAGAQTPSSITCDCGIVAAARDSPEIVRHGLNHSRPAVRVPMRASSPSETMSAAFMAKSDGSSAL